MLSSFGAASGDSLGQKPCHNGHKHAAFGGLLMWLQYLLQEALLLLSENKKVGIITLEGQASENLLGFIFGPF